MGIGKNLHARDRYCFLDFRGRGIRFWYGLVQGLGIVSDWNLHPNWSQERIWSKFYVFTHEGLCQCVPVEGPFRIPPFLGVLRELRKNWRYFKQNFANSNIYLHEMFFPKFGYFCEKLMWDVTSHHKTSNSQILNSLLLCLRLKKLHKQLKLNFSFLLRIFFIFAFLI